LERLGHRAQPRWRPWGIVTDSSESTVQRPYTTNYGNFSREKRENEIATASNSHININNNNNNNHAVEPIITN
jgi:hypothetical protein